MIYNFTEKYDFPPIWDLAEGKWNLTKKKLFDKRGRSTDKIVEAVWIMVNLVREFDQPCRSDLAVMFNKHPSYITKILDGHTDKMKASDYDSVRYQENYEYAKKCLENILQTTEAII